MIRSSISELKCFSEKDNNLKEYLNTKLKHLPKWIKYSVGVDMYREFYNKTFLDYLSSMMNREPLLGLYFSLNGDEVLGWVAYVNEEWNNAISGMRFGSFRMSDSDEDRIKNLRFMQDIRRTFEKKIHSGTMVSFVADRDCPFNRHYHNYIKEAGGGEVIDDGGRYITFVIKEPIPNESEQDLTWRSPYTEKEANDLYEAMKSPIPLEDGKLLLWRIYKDNTFNPTLNISSNKDDVRPEIKHCIKSLISALDDPCFELKDSWDSEAVKWLRAIAY